MRAVHIGRLPHAPAQRPQKVGDKLLCRVKLAAAYAAGPPPLGPSVRIVSATLMMTVVTSRRVVEEGHDVPRRVEGPGLGVWPLPTGRRRAPL